MRVGDVSRRSIRRWTATPRTTARLVAVWATLIALMAFPSEAAARAFTNDPAYAPFVSARQGGSDSRFQLIDNTDLAGTISYLPKG